MKATQIKATTLALLLALLAPAAGAAESTPYECTEAQAFGIKFGDSALHYHASNLRGARGAERFVAYDVVSPLKNQKYTRYSVEADRETKEIYSVTAYAPIVPEPTEAEYDRVFVPIIRKKTEEFGLSNGIQIPTAGRPPYGIESNGLSYSVWHNAGTLYTFTCINQALEKIVQKRAMEEILKKIR